MGGSRGRLRIGIVGCGNVGSRLHLPAWLEHAELAEVVAVADPAPDALENARLAAGLDRADAHPDPAELVARDDVDAVDVCTPQHLRRDLLAEAARAGKHVLCEKPLAAVPADAEAAVDAAAAAGVTLAVVHNYLWLPEIRAARETIGSGELGAIRTVAVDFLGVVDSPGTAAYDGRWRHDAARSGGGVLMDMLHAVYLAEALLGEPLRRVSAWTAGAPGESVEDVALCRYEGDGCAALVNVAWGLGPGGAEVCGAEGRLSIRYEHGGTAPWAPLEHVAVTTAAGTRVVLAGRGDDRGALGISRTIEDSFRLVVADFAAAVRDGRPPASSGADGLRILEATVAAYESAAIGATVALPLDRDGAAFAGGLLGLRPRALGVGAG